MDNCLVRLNTEVMFRIGSMSEFRVLMLMAKLCDSAESNGKADMVVVNGLFLDEARKKLTLCLQTVRNCVCSLCRNGLILKDVRCRGVYYLNPYMVMRGMRSDITDIIRYLQGIGIKIDINT